MAAVQLAQRVGAEIFGTAGNVEKRELLKSLGVQHVMNSRTLDFADEIMSITNGEGVDVVLNSLAGEFIPKSISVLKDTGSFIEIGKNNVWIQDRVHDLKNGIAYFVLYLGEMVDRDPTLARQMLLDLLSDFEKGILKPLPQQIFPVERSVDAFRFMAQAKHTGKIVITQRTPASEDGTIQAHATYLITGGLGGLGLVYARWLAEQGAHHLMLVGRSEASAQAREQLREIEEMGVEVFIAQGDISQEADVKRILDHIADKMPPLRGIIHAAGVLDDGILLEQTCSRFSSVMAPKVGGAWNLHTLTQSMPLDFFILFSAGASLLGSAGQSNYAAANAFLDALAHYRRSCGLPALSINWGPWAEVGMAVKLGDQNQRRWSSQGMDLIRPSDGMKIFGQLLNLSSAQIAVLPIRWNKLKGQNENLEIRPFLRLLIKDNSRSAQHMQRESSSNFHQRLQTVPPEEQRQFLLQYVTDEVTKVLGLN